MQDTTALAGEQWLRWLKIERALLPSTISAYQRELRALWRHARGNLASLTTQDLRDYLLAAGGGSSTIANRIAAMRSFYGFLVRAGLRDDDPTARLDRPKQRKGLPKPIENRDTVLAGLKPHHRHVAIVLLETGLRISEACNLALPVPAPDEVIVKGKGAKDRIVLLTDKARHALDELGGHIPWKPRTVQRWMQKVGVTPHRWRHTFACDLARSGADLGEIQDLLGHASPATTKVYAAYGVERLRRAHERRTQLGQDQVPGNHGDTLDKRITAL